MREGGGLALPHSKPYCKATAVKTWRNRQWRNRHRTDSIVQWNRTESRKVNTYAQLIFSTTAETIKSQGTRSHARDAGTARESLAQECATRLPHILHCKSGHVRELTEQAKGTVRRTQQRISGFGLGKISSVIRRQEKNR